MTQRLVRALRFVRHRPRGLASTSAVGHYGDRGDERLTEDAGPGLPMPWQTGLEPWELGVRFDAVQPRGPYRIWYHEHRFEAHGDRARIIDCARHALALGPLGRIA